MKAPVLSSILRAGALSALCSLFTGCSSLGEHYDSSNNALLESGRSYVHAANEALPQDPVQAKKYVEYAEDALGKPAEDLTTDQLETRHKHDSKVLAERETSAKKLISLGKQKEQENNKNLISRIWHWGLATFGLAGFIAVCVIFPPIIPVLLQLVVHVGIWWVSHFPAIVGAIWRGVYSASSSIYTAIKNSHPK